jgi:hypothetical protein
MFPSRTLGTYSPSENIREAEHDDQLRGAEFDDAGATGGGWANTAMPRFGDGDDPAIGQ